MGPITAVFPRSGIDSKDNLWVFQRNIAGRPQLFKYGPEHKLILSVPESVLGHQDKAHGMAVDPFDNVWVADGDGSHGDGANARRQAASRPSAIKGHRGDWDEAKGQRLLWQPMMIAFSPNGDIYIGEGHANESPNDADFRRSRQQYRRRAHHPPGSDGKFVNQWFGNSVGQGKFSMAHGMAVDPRTVMSGSATASSIAWWFIPRTANSAAPSRCAT